MKIFSMRYLLPLLFAGALASSCDRRNYVQEEGFCTALPDNDTVVFSGTAPMALFTACKENIEAKVVQVSDSRCPEGVQCIWAGKLSVELQMDGGLNMLLEKDKVIDTFYKNNRYSFFLIDATPKPGRQSDSMTAVPKQIKIAITRANRVQPVQPGNTLPIAADTTKKPRA